jgi:hypothetical protein
MIYAHFHQHIIKNVKKEVGSSCVHKLTTYLKVLDSTSRKKREKSEGVASCTIDSTLPAIP